MILSMSGGEVHDLVIERDGEEVVLEDFLMEKHEVTDEKGKCGEGEHLRIMVNSAGMAQKAQDKKD